MTDSKAPAHPSISPVTILVALGAVLLFGWIGFRSGHMVEVYEQVAVPMSVLTQLVLAVPPGLYYVAGFALAAVVVLKDLVVARPHRPAFNTGILAVMFLILLFAQVAIMAPFFTMVGH